MNLFLLVLLLSYFSFGESASFSCVGKPGKKKDGTTIKYTDPAECHHWYECLGGVARRYKCFLSGQRFYEDLQYCKPGSCNSVVDDSCEGKLGMKNDGTTIKYAHSDPTKCSTWFECRDGVYKEYRCFQDGYIFSPSLQYCEEGYCSSSDVELFEGDILMDPITQDIVDGKESDAATFDAMISRKWPNGEIPYIFDSRFDSYRRSVVGQAIAEYNKYTCVKFIPRSSQRDYINFMIGGGCYSMIGRQGGKQDVSIGNGCYYKGTVIHEMMHALGFFHEQSRRDRDKYITIYWNNIMSGMSYNFKMYSHGEADTLNLPYDLDSVMHYEKYAFSSNRQATILSRSNPNRQLGNKRGLSVIDIKQIRAMYQCDSNPTTQGPPTNTTKPPPPPSECKDSHNSCGYWAGIGECERNPVWMVQNCKMSCNQCLGGDCKNNNARCQEWADRGECRRNPAYMLVKCKKSCNRC